MVLPPAKGHEVSTLSLVVASLSRTKVSFLTTTWALSSRAAMSRAKCRLAPAYYEGAPVNSGVLTRSIKDGRIILYTHV